MKKGNEFDVNLFKPKFLNDLIRLGNKGDGGYVINERTIKTTSALISFGVDINWSFEYSFKQANSNVKIFSFDGSVPSATQNLFLKKGIRELMTIISCLLALQFKHLSHHINNLKCCMKRYKDKNFFLSQKGNILVKKNVSKTCSKNSVDLNEVFNIASKNLDLKNNSCFLKMDIEGSEYEIFDQFDNFYNLINQMVVEFHNVHKQWKTFKRIIRILSKSFAITHAHGNNFDGFVRNTSIPKTIEITFLKKELISKNEGIGDQVYPIEGLDYPNLSSKPDMAITFN